MKFKKGDIVKIKQPCSKRLAKFRLTVVGYHEGKYGKMVRTVEIDDLLSEGMLVLAEDSSTGDTK